MSVAVAMPTRHGWGVLLPVVPLCLLGLFSIEASVGVDEGMAVETSKQLVFILAGLSALVTACFIGYHRLGRMSYSLFFLCIIVLGWLAADHCVNLPLVAAQRNARRWLRAGPVQIQPSELAKIAYVLALAWYLRYKKSYRTMAGLVPPFILTLVPMALILIQPDLGTVMLFLPVLFAMLYAAGARVKHLMTVVLLAILAMPFFGMKIKSYQRLRVTGVVLQAPLLRDYLREHPGVWDSIRPKDMDAKHWRKALEEWGTDSGFQLVRSKLAIGSGGLTGYGWNDGPFVHYNFLPEKHNDFIFAMISHQWGLLGSLLVIGCYAMFVLFGFDIAATTQDPFGRLVAVGLTTMIAVQALTNLCMTVGLGPITGVTLPFVSAGGSSIIACFASVGLLLSVSYHRPTLIANPPFEFDEDREREFVPATR